MQENNISQFQERISLYIKSRFPLIYIVTWEEEGTINAIRDMVRQTRYFKQERDVFTWSVTQGLTIEDKIIDSHLTDPIKTLDYILQYSGDGIFILTDFYAEFARLCGRNTSDQLLIRKVKNLIVTLKKSNYRKTVILTGYEKFIPNDLQKEILIEEFPLPDEEELKKIILNLIHDNCGNSRLSIDQSEQTIHKLCRAALGLTSFEAENAFALALVEDGKLDESDLSNIIREKKQIIKQSGILEFIDNKMNINDIGGLNNLKKWLQKRKETWSEKAIAYQLPRPKGLLITGVPGCGKSLTAKSVSSLWNLPLLRLDIGSIFEGIVGSSERNMREVIRTAESISPCILWIDEIEKAFAGVGSSGDSGVGTRLFGTFLTWMQDKTSFVFVIATANNISNLPPEFMRKGRFDEIFFVDLPVGEERKAIFSIHLHKKLNRINSDPQLLSEEFVQHLVDQTEGFTGSEIEELINSALIDAFSEERKVKEEDFIKAIKTTVPLSVTQAEQIKALRAWANVRAISATSIFQVPEKQETSSPDQRGGRFIEL